VSSLERVDEFMYQNDVVHDLSSLHITRFLVGNDEGEDMLETQRNDLGDDFINYIAERDWPKILQIGYTFLLGDESKKISIQSREDFTRSTIFLIYFPNIFPNHRPTVLE